jgi:hypothetical protein
MIFMTFISMHSIIICVVFPWRTYEMHPALSLKSGCDTRAMREHSTDLEQRSLIPECSGSLFFVQVHLYPFQSNFETTSLILKQKP